MGVVFHFLLSLFVLLQKVKDFISTEVSEEEFEEFHDAFATLSLEDQESEKEEAPSRLEGRREAPLSVACSSSRPTVEGVEFSSYYLTVG